MTKIIIVSGARSINEVIAEIWRATLLSVRVLDGDLELLDYVSLTALPMLNKTIVAGSERLWQLLFAGSALASTKY